MIVPKIDIQKELSAAGWSVRKLRSVGVNEKTLYALQSSGGGTLEKAAAIAYLLGRPIDEVYQYTPSPEMVQACADLYRVHRAESKKVKKNS